ncbi:MAG: transglycosylase SLT domain-containing protein [Thermocrispum sp.]
MSKLSPADIAQHALDAGFRGDALTTAVAVAMAESGGDPRAHNATPPDNSYGLWQINMLGGLGPARRDQFDLESNRELFRPSENAGAAKQIFDDAGDSWGPWSTYTNGAYRQYLDEARRAVGTVDRDRGEGDNGGRKPGRDTAASLLGDGKGGYRVDPEALHAYGRRGHRLAGELRQLTRHEISDVGKSARGFGKAGVESGFADALHEFSGALKHQVKAVSKRADALATATRRVARAYQERERETVDDARAVARGGGLD